MGMNLTLEARRMRILHRLYKTGVDMFRPCIKIGEDGNWYKIKERSVLDYTENKELYAIFPLTIDFDNTEKYVEIAFTFPYTHVQMMKDIEQLNLYHESTEPLYFHREILTKSCEGFDCPLITISSHDMKLDSLESYPVLDGTSKCRRFDSKKPVILLSSRVLVTISNNISQLIDKKHRLHCKKNAW